MTQSSQIKMQDLLSAVTDALIAEEAQDVDQIIDQYDVSRSEVDGLLFLIEKLHIALTGKQPSRRFAASLKRDLLGARKWGLLWRIRSLPPRVQIAAVAAVIAGFIIVMRRRLMEYASQEEVPALQ